MHSHKHHGNRKSGQTISTSYKIALLMDQDGHITILPDTVVAMIHRVNILNNIRRWTTLLVITKGKNSCQQQCSVEKKNGWMDGRMEKCIFHSVKCFSVFPKQLSCVLWLITATRNHHQGVKGSSTPFSFQNDFQCSRTTVLFQWAIKNTLCALSKFNRHTRQY